MKNDNILVLGASDNPNRISFSAIKLMLNRGLNLYAMGPQKGKIEQLEVSKNTVNIQNADTITIFLSANKQRKYYEYILSLKPKRIILNPGSENPELEFLAQKNHIQIIKGCTIAMIVNGFL